MSKRKDSRLNVQVPRNKAYQLNPVEIVADGSIATGSVAMGHLTPVLILNVQDRPDIRDIIQAHASRESGDVTVHWGRPDTAEGKQYMVSLILQFLRPVESFVLINFDTDRAMLVDQILKSGFVYIQAGKPGDRLSDTLDTHARVLIEVQGTHFEQIWEPILLDHLIAEFRFRGLDRKLSRQAARMTVEEWRRFGNFRMPNRPAELF